jgi:hypothetical protein
MPDTAGEDDLELHTVVVGSGDEVAEQIFACEQRMWRARAALRESLAHNYLGGVSLVVRVAFVDAMASGQHRPPLQRSILCPAVRGGTQLVSVVGALSAGHPGAGVKYGQLT